MTKVRYLGFRIVQTVFVLWLVLTLLFLFFRLLPGDFTSLMTYQGSSPEAIAAFKEKWGLNDPLYVQYYRYMMNFIQFDVGTSVRFREPVWGLVSRKILNSFILIGPAITFSYILGSGLGAVLGTIRDSLTERYVVIAVLFLGSIPSFAMGLLLIIVFATQLDWLPTSGMISPGTVVELRGEPWWRMYFTVNFAKHYILPFSAVVLRYLFLPVLIMRTSVIEVRNQDFFTYHRLTGLRRSKRLRHLARHASLPVITMYPISMTRAIGGLVLIEIVFNWPGIGAFLVESVIFRDVPTVQFVFFLVAAFIIISNLIIDLLYSVIDPRVSLE